ncbi:DNA alkylation repair protein [Candidatus Parcubacteria bacterium]|nr:DNA alkylation repair protein [Candidatus Parcubacteria bacterium]
MTAIIVKQELNSLADSPKGKILSRFFKTGPGEYGEGDIFLGIKVPDERRVARKYRSLPLGEVTKLLQSKIHDHRQTALFILVDQFQKADPDLQKKIYQLYLDNTQHINNWDLIDCSAPKIVGDYLLDKSAERKILYKLAKSKILWERRIAILTTYTFIKGDQFDDTLKIAELLLHDEHDLIHKAVGWMLREVGKKDQKIEEKFLKKYYREMPRTMLRYAIEKFPEEKRQSYLKK